MQTTLYVIGGIIALIALVIFAANPIFKFIASIISWYYVRKIRKAGGMLILFLEYDIEGGDELLALISNVSARRKAGISTRRPEGYVPNLDGYFSVPWYYGDKT